MDVNPFHIARRLTAVSLEFSANRRGEVCKTRRFCTRYVGPPPHVQNYLRPKPFRSNNFKRCAASAHQDPPRKTQKSTSATHFRTNTPNTNVRKQSSRHAPTCRSCFAVTAHGVCLLHSCHRCAKPRGGVLRTYAKPR